MASFTIVTTPQQDAILSWVAKNYNLEHDLTLTLPQFVQIAFPLSLAPHVENYREAVAEAVAAKFRDAPPALQADIMQRLGATP